MGRSSSSPDCISPPSALNRWETWWEWEGLQPGDSGKCPHDPWADPPGQHSCQKGSTVRQTWPVPSELSSTRGDCQPSRTRGDCQLLPHIQFLHSWHRSWGSLAWNLELGAGLSQPAHGPGVLAPCFVTCGTWGQPQFPLLVPPAACGGHAGVGRHLSTPGRFLSTAWPGELPLTSSWLPPCPVSPRVCNSGVYRLHRDILSVSFLSLISQWSVMPGV